MKSEILYKAIQVIGQLGKMRGGYFFVQLNAEDVNQFPLKNKTRLVCTLENSLSFSCGLNHIGDGNYFIILASKYLSTLGKKLNDKIYFQVFQDTNPLGVEIPEVLIAMLEQDVELKKIFENLTDGKKRNIIFNIIKIKNIDLQISKTPSLILESTFPRAKKVL